MNIPLYRIEAFQELVYPEPNTGCWLWGGNLHRQGYGRIFGYYAHRLSYHIHNGEIPHGMHVLHRCDNPCCVNPDHLWLGTHADNMRDKFLKGRAPSVHIYSEDRWNAKLTIKDILSIKAKYLFGMLQKDIAAQYNVSRATICLIINNKTWQRTRNQ